MLKQPLKEPSLYANTSKNEIWNENFDSIKFDLSEDVKRKIAIELTRISTIGFAENNEFASLISFDTGDVIFGLKKGVRNENGKLEINLDDWKSYLINSSKNSLIIAHNHPNKGIHSFDDIKTFYKYKSVKCMLVISGDKIFNLQRKKDTIEDIDKFNKTLEKYEYGIAEFTVNGETDSEKLLAFFRKVFGEIGVIFERW